MGNFSGLDDIEATLNTLKAMYGNSSGNQDNAGENGDDKGKKKGTAPKRGSTIVSGDKFETAMDPSGGLYPKKLFIAEQ